MLSWMVDFCKNGWVDRGDLTFLSSSFLKTERLFGWVVDNMCESVWGNSWETCVKVSTCGGFYELLHKFWGKVWVIRRIGGKFYGWICTVNYPCFYGSFAHFPQSLLLQLLNI